MATTQIALTTQPESANLALFEKWMQELVTVPGFLKFARAATIFAAIVFAGLAYLAYANLRHGIQAIGRDTIPLIGATEKIRTTLADANSNAVNFFLSGEADDAPSWIEYRHEIDDVQSNLIIASQNTAYGDEERQPILDMTTSLTAYERLIDQARDHRQNDFHPDLEAAEQIMRDNILTAAAALDKANFAHLNATYQAHRSRFGVHNAPAIADGIVLFGLLLSTQLFLALRTRRIINPGLATATIALAVCALYAASIFPRAEASMISAKEDAFDSIHALWRMRAVAYDARVDESAYLLDQGKSDKQSAWTNKFGEKAALLAVGDSDKLLKNIADGRSFQGYLSDELANITYPGERDAAMEMVRTWVAYLDIDKQIRQLEGEGKYKDALALDIGTQTGQSNGAFAKFNDALGKTLAINQREFDGMINHAFHMLSRFVYVLAFATTIIIVATAVGLKARLDEYRFRWQRTEVLEREHDAIRAALMQGRESLATLMDLGQRCRAACEETKRKIAAPPTLQPSIAEEVIESLSAWLMALDETVAAGRWAAAKVDLNKWREAITARIDAERAAYTFNRMALDERADLHSRFEALQFKAQSFAARGIVLGETLERLTGETEQALYQRPFQLEHGRQMLAAYEIALAAKADKPH